MPDLTSITLLYTQDLGGDLLKMAKLYSYIEQLKLRYGSVLVVDLGGQCSRDAWHCTVTEGRSSLVVLDGMGYHAANVRGALTEESRQKIIGTLTMALVDERRAWRYHVPPLLDEGVLITADPSPALRLNIVLTPADATRLDNGTLFMGRVAAWTVGVVQVDLTNAPRITHTAAHKMPDAIPAHPTITAAAEFVMEEARWLSRRVGG